MFKTIKTNYIKIINQHVCMKFLPRSEYLSVCFSEPFDPPQNVTFANVTASSVALLWHPPTEPNGLIVHYSIYYSYNDTVAEQVRHKLSFPRTDLSNPLPAAGSCCQLITLHAPCTASNSRASDRLVNTVILLAAKETNHSLWSRWRTKQS